MLPPRTYVAFTLALFVVPTKTSDSIFYHGSESYMSDVSLERFYLMEENVMSNADVLLRPNYFDAAEEQEETEEEHSKHKMNMTEIESVLARAKDLHRNVGPDLGNFLGHPINVFHLFRRLDAEWRRGLDVLLKTNPCKLWKISAMRRYLAFLRDNIPGENDVKAVVRQISRLQNIHGTPTRDVAQGWLGDSQAISPLSVEDWYQIGMILYEDDTIAPALSWFELVRDWLKYAAQDDVKGLSFKEEELLAKLASGYYMVGRLEGAIDVSQRLLDLDPSNNRLLENLNFFLMKQTVHQLDGSLKRQQRLDITQPTTQFEKICAGKVVKPSRKRCRLEPVFGKVSWYCHKKEMLRYRPEINLYHDVINDFAMKQLREYTHSKLTNKAWISSGVFITPPMGAEIVYSDLPRKKSIRYSAQKLAQAFLRVPGPNPGMLTGWGRMQILNAGRTGMHLSRYDVDLQLKPVKSVDKRLGAMFAFLSEPALGGEIVMRSKHVFSPVPKGSILVYHSTQSKLHSLCPALGGSQWVAVQPFYERDQRMSPKRRRWF